MPKGFRHGLCIHEDRQVRLTYKAWSKARSRCRNPKDPDYHSYGGRGISFSTLWDDPLVFFKEMGAKPEGLTLDRIDVNKNYEPGNCRWATLREQKINQRRTRFVTVDGITQCVMDWCRQLGMEPNAFRHRAKKLGDEGSIRWFMHNEKTRTGRPPRKPLDNP